MNKSFLWFSSQVEIARVLNKRHKVETKQIAVLTPYSAQKNLIEEEMTNAHLNIKVTSITESQGEVCQTHTHTCMHVTLTVVASPFEFSWRRKILIHNNIGLLLKWWKYTCNYECKLRTCSSFTLIASRQTHLCNRLRWRQLVAISLIRSSHFWSHIMTIEPIKLNEQCSAFM